MNKKVYKLLLFGCLYFISTHLFSQCIDNSNKFNTDNCSDVVDPVCGCDGITYLNACYAEAAGVKAYTKGTCQSGCIDASQIATNINACPQLYAPVCGCNEVTYSNSCEAENAGIVTYTEGACSDQNNCYSPELILNRDEVEVSDKGALAFNCPEIYEPVCGCDNITYDNSCEAEVSGVTFYTSGECESSCIETPQANVSCSKEYYPVCGCNGVTYSNSCFAEKAGVKSYTRGICGETSLWCQKAEALACGAYKEDWLKAGETSLINNYPGCNNYNFSGAEKIYRIEKTGSGPLQVGLEIQTIGTDLDLFILKDECSVVSCVGQSITSNSASNNEGIILDVPIGSYYIVVDAQKSTKDVEFRLEVGCEALECWSNVSLTCGETYNGTTVNGFDNVVAYYGKNLNKLNVDNNGPEVVHEFTITERGEVDILLSNLSSDLELILLNSCNLKDMIAFSQNTGRNNESIKATLDEGTYYVVVDGYNGAQGSYNLRVNCASSCGISINETLNTAATCGKKNGVYKFKINGGKAPYIITFTGDAYYQNCFSGSQISVSSIGAGNYNVKVQDADGCVANKSFVIQDEGGGLSVNLSTVDASCGSSKGSATVSVPNGKRPLKIILSGAASASNNDVDNNFTIPNLPVGDYNLFIQDTDGCSKTVNFTINQNTNSNLYLSTEVTNIGCNSTYGAATFKMDGGKQPYQLEITGSTNRQQSNLNTNSHTFNNLSAGRYNGWFTDANGCVKDFSFEVTRSTSGLDLTVDSKDATCGVGGSVKVFTAGGKSPYQLEMTGPINQKLSSNNGSFNFNELLAGNYHVKITDANGCSKTRTFVINDKGSNMQVYAYPTNGTCGNNGFATVNIENGVAPYQFDISGAKQIVTSSSDASTGFGDLKAGSYQGTVTDAQGCKKAFTFDIEINENKISFSTNVDNGSCGEKGRVTLSANGGQPSYTFSIDGPIKDETLTPQSSYTFKNLPNGTYKATVMDAFWCSQTTEFVINAIESPLVLNIETNNGTCDNPASANVIINQGRAPYFYTLSGPSTTSFESFKSDTLLQNLETGNYTISVIDDNGCAVQQNFAVRSIPKVHFYVAEMNSSCADDGGARIVVNTGTKPFDISITGAANRSVTTQNNTQDFMNIPSGSYVAKVVDANGCQLELAFDIDGIQNTIEVTPEVVNGFCGENGEVDIWVQGGLAPYNVSINGPKTGNLSNVTSGNIKFKDLPRGDYSGIITDANGCSRSFTFNVISQNTDLAYTISPNNGTCNGLGSVTFAINGSFAPYIVLVDGPKDYNRTSNTGALTIEDLEEGNYLVKIKDSKGCELSKRFSIEGNQTNIIISPEVIQGSCSQNGKADIWIQGGIAPYDVSIDGPKMDNLVDVYSGDAIFEDLPNGNYTGIATDINGCSKSFTFKITSTAEITVDLDVNNGYCTPVGNVGIDISGGVMPFTLEIDGPTKLKQTIGRQIEIGTLTAGEYNGKLVDQNGCIKTFNFSIKTVEEISLNTNVKEGTCGQNGQVNINASGGTAPYQFILSGKISREVSSPTGIISWTDLTTGSYSITVKDQNGCTRTEQFSILKSTEATKVQAVFRSGTCDTKSLATISISGGEKPYKVIVSGPEDKSITTSQNSIAYEGLTGGIYKVNVTDANNCTSTTTFEATTSSNIAINTDVSSQACESTGNVTIVVAGAAIPYEVKIEGPISMKTSWYDNVGELTSIPSGNYKGTITDNNGCTKSFNFTIQEAEGLTVNSNIENGSCGQKGQMNLSISSGLAPYKIDLSGQLDKSNTVNANSYVEDNLENGNYKIRVTDSEGCVFEENFTITNLPKIKVFSQITNANCAKQGEAVINFNSGIKPYKVIVTGPINRQFDNVYDDFVSFDGLPEGEYTSIVSDAKGCTQPLGFTIEQSSVNFVATITAIGSCSNKGGFEYKVVGGFSPYTISYTGASKDDFVTSNLTGTVNDLSVGNYKVKITDAKGCSVTNNISISSTQSTLVVNSQTRNQICDSPGTTTLRMSGGTKPYTIKWSGTQEGEQKTSEDLFVISNLTVGAYNFSVEDANGCSKESYFTIAEDNNLEVEAWAVNGGCAQALGSGKLRIGWGEIPFHVRWDGPIQGEDTFTATSYSINSMPAGDYTITVTDDIGCVVQKKIRVYIEDAVKPDAAFRFDQYSLKVYFESLSSGEHHKWDFGDGNTSSLKNPTHEYKEAGTYSIKLIVENECGKDEFTKEITVTKRTAARLVIGNAKISNNENVTVPVYLENQSEVYQLQGTVSIENNEFGTFERIDDAQLTNILYNKEVFQYVSENGENVKIDNAKPIFHMVFKIMPSFTAGKTAVIINNSIMESRVTYVQDGEMVDDSLASTSGNIFYEQSTFSKLTGQVYTWKNIPVSGTEMLLSEVSTAKKLDANMTSNDGKFDFDGVGYGKGVRLTAKKAGEWSTSPNATYGLAMMQQQILGQEAISSPYQLLASDLNCSNSLTQEDLLIGQQMITNSISTLDNCSQWVITPQGNLDPNESNIFDIKKYLEVDKLNGDLETPFVATKRGDIMGEYDPENKLTSPLFKSSSPISLVLGESVEKNGSFLYPVYLNAESDLDVFALQFNLDFGQEGVVSILPTAQINDNSIWNIEGTELKFSWFDLAANGFELNENEPIFQLRTTELLQNSAILQLKNDIPATLHDTDGMAFDLILEQSNVEEGTLELEVGPNPIADNFTVNVLSDKSQTGLVQVVSALGQVMVQRNVNIEVGNNTELIQTSSWPATIYYVRFMNEDKILTQKVVKQ